MKTNIPLTKLIMRLAIWSERIFHYEIRGVITALFLLVLVLSGTAQNTETGTETGTEIKENEIKENGGAWEVSGEIGGGMSRLKPRGNSLDFSTKKHWGLWGGIKPAYFFNEHWGISFGLGLSRYNADVILSDYTGTHRTIVPWTDEVSGQPGATQTPQIFTVETNNTDVNERVKLLMLDIPVSVKYRNDFNERIKLNDKPLSFIGEVGVKVGLPLSSSYRLKSSKLTTHNYFPEKKLMHEFPIPDFFKEESDWHPDGELSTTKLTASLFASAGAEYPINERLSASLSLYYSYGLSDAIKDKHSSLMYRPGAYNSVSTLGEKGQLSQLGLTLGIRFGKKKAESAPDQEAIPMVEAPDSIYDIEKADSVVLTDSLDALGLVINTRFVDAISLRMLDNADYEIVDDISKALLMSGRSDNDAKVVLDLKSAEVPKNLPLVITVTVESGDFSSYTLQLLSDSMKNYDLDNPIALTPLMSKRDKLEDNVVASEERVGGAAFAFDDYRLTPKGAEYLDAWGDFLLKNPHVKIRLMTHTDNRGSVPYNLKLSQRRALESERYLMSKGIRDVQVLTHAYGEKFPLIDCPVCTEEDHSMNRRIEIEVINAK